MHSVNRGCAPAELSAISSKYTPAWIAYHTHGRGKAPRDARWRDFHDTLKRRFHGLCGYCEELCAGEIDHFRPKSRNPELVYCWSNWVFSCRDCNLSKWSRWPTCGYVSPCPTSKSEQPENYFDFDMRTCEIITKSNIERKCFDKAHATIRDLDLNSIVKLKKRAFIIGLLREILSCYGSDVGTRICSTYANRNSQFSSLG